ncbi:anoctamin-6 isoform X2 [Scaptodrosophila lebanonensis]|nr:anoctamin-6 isoform X2 [Scaptodrosophila lebanonensis]XP_030386594.1 anoctamin-6 isoform X2 [Scaptodrosophila lebanonensis]
MDERESLYFDTISLAESEAAAAAAHRKSLSQSRNTIYHSAVDLAADEARHMRLAWQPGYRQSTALEHLNGFTDQTDSGRMSLQNGRTNHDYGSGNGNRNGIGNENADDEVSRRLLRQSSTVSNKNKKLPITYSQWKLRTYRFFEDKKRSVDFVLAYDSNNCGGSKPVVYEANIKGDGLQLEEDQKLELGRKAKEEEKRKRKIFEANMKREGLQLELCGTQFMQKFIKIHAPDHVLYHYAEILKIKMPMKPIPGQELIFDGNFEFKTRITRMFRRLFSSVQLSTKDFEEREPRIHMEFARKYLHLFDKNHRNFFDASTRYAIINFIMQRQHFVEGEETPDNIGIEKLLQDGVYSCAYTLHEKSDREKLLKEWANIRKWHKLQPLDYIKDYFGAKVALYFAWLGFYTQMLIPISIFGILCILYGFLTWSSDSISHDICADNGSTIMCPQCDRNCNFWKLSDTCTSSRYNYLIDNNVTVVFALVLSVWAVIYLEFWKRYSAGLVHRWGLTGFTHHVEHPRPQYLAKIANSKLAKKGTTEASLGAQTSSNGRVPLDTEVPFWSYKFLPNFTSYSIMVLFICISVIAIFAVIIYRMAQNASHSILGNENSTTHKIMVLPITAGIIDLVVISVLDLVYSKLAISLTNYEYCRTQTEYDESLTIKNYLFQFVNYYSSLFYIAFLKGKFVGYPAKYNRILGFRQEECNPGGCLMELCMQLVIIMVGKQAVNSIVEMLIPYLIRKFHRLNNYKNSHKEKVVVCSQWTEDYNLIPFSNSSLYEEYLEMVMQYGFITLFSIAFPLAPLLALLNNIIEVRLDAIKMLRFMRRPVGMRAHDIGVWHNIMYVVTRIAVASSAMIIAFSSNLIPKLVYSITKEETPDRYLNFTLAYFNTSDFEMPLTLNATLNITQCRYTEFRNPPEHQNPYKRPMIYWKILTARLAFIVIYQNIIGILQGILRWAVPDVPGKLLKRIKRENFLLREHIIEFEKQHAAQLAKENALHTPEQELRHRQVPAEDSNDQATTSV